MVGSALTSVDLPSTTSRIRSVIQASLDGPPDTRLGERSQGGVGWPRNRQISFSRSRNERFFSLPRRSSSAFAQFARGSVPVARTLVPIDSLCHVSQTAGGNAVV